ncbi:MAG: AtpZ/AtpI family protein, partial [Phycisphaerales bacterium]
MAPSDDPEQGQHPYNRDPRLEIPEILRSPVKQSNYDPVYGSRANRPSTPELAGAVKAWAIALDFVVTIIAGAGLGYLVDRWLHSLPIATL